MRFDVADAAHLPFPDGSFDAAFEHTVLEHVADPAAVVGEMRRVLAPVGVIGLRDGDRGDIGADLFLEPRTIERMAAHGLADRAAMEGYAAALRDWGGQPGAVDAGLNFHSLGWLT